MGKIYKNGIEYGGGGGSGTGGHTIVDTDGSPVADEPKLQFTGLDVQDNSTDSETEVAAFGLNTDSLDDIISSGSATTNPMVTNGLTYSTTEQVVGKWVDGKPLYQKTIVNTLPETTTDMTQAEKGISIGAQVEQVAFYEAFFQNANGYTFAIDNTKTGVSDVTGDIVWWVSADVTLERTPGNASIVRFFNSRVLYNGLPCWITIRYTKTTD